VNKSTLPDLDNELQLLYRSEATFKVPATPTIRQLIAEIERPLLDKLPAKPTYDDFHWPESGGVDFQTYWRGREWNPWHSESG